jgi:hypothetical protein
LSDEYKTRILHSYLRRLLILLAVTVLRYPRPRGREILYRLTAGSMNRYHYLTEVETRLTLIPKYAVDQSKQNAILAYSAFISIE